MPWDRVVHDPDSPDSQWPGSFIRVARHTPTAGVLESLRLAVLDALVWLASSPRARRRVCALRLCLPSARRALPEVASAVTAAAAVTAAENGATESEVSKQSANNNSMATDVSWRRG